MFKFTEKFQNRLICALAFLLFVWPSALIFYTKLEVWLAYSSPVEINERPTELNSKPEALQKHGLEETKNTLDPVEPSDSYVLLALHADGPKIQRVQSHCESANLSIFSPSDKTFNLSKADKDSSTPFAIACFPSLSKPQVAFLLTEDNKKESLNRGKTKKASKGYFVTIPSVRPENSHVIFVLLSNKEAHVKWAQLTAAQQANLPN